MSRLAGGVVVLSTRLGTHDHAMTASAVCSVSLEPPLVLACVEVAARFHDAVLESGVLGMSILTAAQRAHADWLATPGRPVIGQLDRIPVHRAPSGVVLLDESLATLDCVTWAVHPAGDHSIVVAEVMAITLADDPEAALVYYRNRFGSLA
ncbi:MAG: flavin reductase [Tetrasphaera sp.]|nr:flavin reductase [Tetrasphaera sp.]